MYVVRQNGRLTLSEFEHGLTSRLSKPVFVVSILYRRDRTSREDAMAIARIVRELLMQLAHNR